MLTRAVARSGMSLGNAVALLAGHRTVVSDTFTRADNATTLGNTETGQTWTALSATWGTISNTAYTTTSVSNAAAVVDAKVSDGIVRVTTSTINTDNGVIARCTDNSNYLRFIFEAGTWYLQKSVAGAFTTIASTAGSNSNGDVVELEVRGSTLTGRVNGAVLCSGSDSFNSTATKFGMMTSNGNARLDNFLVLS